MCSVSVLVNHNDKFEESGFNQKCFLGEQKMSSDRCKNDRRGVFLFFVVLFWAPRP